MLGGGGNCITERVCVMTRCWQRAPEKYIAGDDAEIYWWDKQVMGKSNRSLLTDEIIVVTQPKSTENNLKILTNTHIPRENKWTIYSRLSRLFLQDTDVLRYGFYNVENAGSAGQEQVLYKEQNQ